MYFRFDEYLLSVKYKKVAIPKEFDAWDEKNPYKPPQPSLTNLKP